MAEVYFQFKNKLNRWPCPQKSEFFPFYIIITSLSMYPFLYAFQKLEASGLYKFEVWGIGFKYCLIMIQVLGYILAGVLKGNVETKLADKIRGLLFLQLISVAGSSLLLFSLTPAPYNIPFLFFNGLSLGLVWGLIIRNLKFSSILDERSFH